MKKVIHYLSVTQAAKLIGVSRQYFYEMIDNELIPEPIIREGQAVLYSKAEIQEVKRKRNKKCKAKNTPS